MQRFKMRFRFIVAAVFGVVAFAVAYLIQSRLNPGIAWNGLDTPPAWFLAFVAAAVAAAVVLIFSWLFLAFWRLLRASLEGTSISFKSKLAVAITICLLFIVVGGLLWSFGFFQIRFYSPSGSYLWGEELEAQYLRVGGRLVAIGMVLFAITFAYFLFGYGRVERKP